MFRFKIYFLYLIVSFTIFAKDIPPLPNPPKLVNDFAGILQPQESNQLEQKLRIYNDSSSTHIAIVIENSLEGDDVFDYSFRLAQNWGIGQKDKNNGALIYIAIQDRKIRIQVGYGLEATLTDAACKQIIEELIKPTFKQGQYYAGLDAATSRILAITKGEYQAEPKSANGGKSKLIIIIIIVVALLLLSAFNKNGGGGRTYSSSGSDWWTAAMIGNAMSGSRNRGGSSWGDFSSGGGSFGGFGGGGFGGGGSGGDW